MSVEVEETTQSLLVRAGWSDVVLALPIPAAIVDATGVVLAMNSLTTVKPGSALISGKHQDQDGLWLGADGTSRWRLRALAKDQGAFLATAHQPDSDKKQSVVVDPSQQAMTDQLTGVSSRARLITELERCVANEQSTHLLFVDLDRFKLHSDSLGYLAGDDLLAALARRLDNAVGGAGRLVARFRGDKFGVLLPSTSLEEATLAAQTARKTTEEAFTIAGRQLHVSMSVGIASVDTDSGGVEQILRHADMAVYEAKRSDSGVVVFDEKLQLAVDRRVDVEAGLRGALRDREIVAFYQPVVEIGTNKRIGYEALVRWHRGNELLTAGAFVDVAEESGLMPEVTSVVWFEAFALAGELRRSGLDQWVSINVSPSELAAPDFVERFLEGLLEAGASPEQLVLEITESAFLHGDKARTFLNKLRDVGVRVSLDDFGTGYSSLAQLRDLPIDMVKIDRSFTLDVVENEMTRAMTSSVIELCEALGLTVVVEGIETAAHESVIADLGGTVAQGWHYDSALPAQVLLM